MTKFNLKQFVEIIGFLGIIFSMLFVGYELRQSNAIATRDSRANIIETNSEMKRLVLESPEITDLMLKLSKENEVLSEREVIQAREIAELQGFFWGTVAVAQESGYLPERVHEFYLGSAKTIVNRYPGLAPFYKEVLASVGPGFGEIYDAALDELNKND